MSGINVNIQSPILNIKIGFLPNLSIKMPVNIEFKIKRADKIENIWFSLMLWWSHNMLYCARKDPLDKSI